MKVKVDAMEFDLNSEEIHMIKRIYRFCVHPQSTLLTMSDKETIKSLKDKDLVKEDRLFFQSTSMGNKVYKKLVGAR